MNNIFGDMTPEIITVDDADGNEVTVEVSPTLVAAVMHYMTDYSTGEQRFNEAYDILHSIYNEERKADGRSISNCHFRYFEPNFSYLDLHGNETDYDFNIVNESTHSIDIVDYMNFEDWYAGKQHELHKLKAAAKRKEEQEKADKKKERDKKTREYELAELKRLKAKYE